MDETPDGWYRQLSIQFEDGSVELLHIERKPTGTHIPLLRERPEPWTKLTVHKCPCCPLPDILPTCPAAVSLQTTMSKLRSRKSIERVKATAIDANGRSQTVEWPLQAVGSSLVQLAVFASGCPVGRRLKPFLQGLPPFVSSLDLSRRIATMILQKHGGSIEASRQELAESLAPLHDVFTHLTRRIRVDEQDKIEGMDGIAALARDAVPNSITAVDAFAQLLAVRANSLFAQLSTDLGWTGAAKPARPAAPAQPKAGGWWQRLAGLFR
ncbi:MAG: hypothetical protein WC728_00230 [Elusimicrobiota bacterium]